MKRSLILFAVLCLSAVPVLAQKKHELGLNYQWIGSSILSPWGDGWVGSSHYDYPRSNSFGLEYRHFAKPWLAIQSGLDFYFSQIGVSTSPSAVGPDGPFNTYHEQISIVSIPVMAEVYFLKYFFVNGGLSLGLDLSKGTLDRQTGIGFALGIGAQYPLNDQLRIYINPIARQHATSDGSRGHEKLYQAGIKFGMTYQL